MEGIKMTSKKFPLFEKYVHRLTWRNVDREVIEEALSKAYEQGKLDLVRDFRIAFVDGEFIDKNYKKSEMRMILDWFKLKIIDSKNHRKDEPLTIELVDYMKRRVKRWAVTSPPFGNKKSFYGFLDSSQERLKSQLKLGSSAVGSQDDKKLSKSEGAK